MGGLTVKGTDVWTAKLSPNDVREIRALAGRMRQADIARKYGVSRQAVLQILQRKTWKHVT